MELGFWLESRGETLLLMKSHLTGGPSRGCPSFYPESSGPTGRSSIVVGLNDSERDGPRARAVTHTSTAGDDGGGPARDVCRLHQPSSMHLGSW
jgi:hypothetical protein